MVKPGTKIPRGNDSQSLWIVAINSGKVPDYTGSLFLSGTPYAAPILIYYFYFNNYN